jgi:hypothetical protein
MTRTKAGKLLGGHATGTLTEAERQALYAAALADQALFDALADEEALRELLADPAARAQLLAALAPASELGPPKVVPFWRRPGVLGAAAGLIVATTAGLAVLRSPQDLPRPAVTPEAARAPLAATPVAATPSPEAKALPPGPAGKPRPKPEAMLNQALDAPAAGRLSPAPVAVPAPVPVAASVVAPVADSAPAPVAASVGVPPPLPAAQAVGAPAEEARVRAQAESRRMEARDEMAKKAKAVDRYRSAAMESVSPAPVPARRVAATAAAPLGAAAEVVLAPAPVWTLETLPDGATRVRVAAAPGAHVALLRRNRSGVEALRPEPLEASGPWTFRVRLAPGDGLDLYVLNAPVADAAQLPETGPVDGFRARIHPAGKKDAPR